MGAKGVRGLPKSRPTRLNGREIGTDNSGIAPEGYFETVAGEL